jgi:hypothetical protein
MYIDIILQINYDWNRTQNYLNTGLHYLDCLTYTFCIKRFPILFLMAAGNIENENHQI